MTAESARPPSVDLDARLAGWVAAGLLREDQAAAIRRHEAGTSGAGAIADARGDAATRAERGGWRPWLAEVVGYVGAAFALGALALILDDLWDRLAVGGRLALAGLLTLLVIGAGAAVSPRSAAPLRRLGAVLWTAGVAGTAWTTALAADGPLGVPERWQPTTVSGAALVVALVLLARGGHAAVQLAALVATGVLAVSLLDAAAPLPPSTTALGALLLGLGTAWALAGAGGWLGPRRVAEVAGTGLALVGTQVLAAADRPLPGLWLGLVLAAGLAALSVPTGRPHLLLVGAAGLFISVPRLVFELFADTLGAPVTLLAVGLLLILLAVGLARVRGLAVELRRESGDA
jgi:hypothetical protein